MRLEDRFELAAPPAQVWQVLNDIETIAPYVPGFQLTEAAGDVFKGMMTVKLGAMTVQYDAEIEVTERDESAMTVVMAVSGRERRGTGRMKAAVRSSLEPAVDGTAVALETDLGLSGKVAQMGRGMIADVSKELISQFVQSLEAEVLTARSDDASVEPQPAGTQGSARVVDVTGVAGRSAAKRLGPLAVVLLLLLVLFVLYRA